MTLDVVDAEECFSRSLAPYRLIQGEFNVTKPYFHSNPNHPKKKRKKSVTNEGTAERHEELRPLLTECLTDLKTIWKTKEPFEAEKKEGKNEIDFPSIQSMVEAAHVRFTQEQTLELVDLSLQNYNLDIFSIFNKLYINPTAELKQLEITPTATYLIPPLSSFIMGSMTDDSLQHLSEYVSSSGKADLIVMDPPWPNKSVLLVHRSSKYETQDIYDLFGLPIKDMIQDDTLVAVWVTNKPKFRAFIINKLFPSWQLECVSEWVWLKLTTQGECIFPLDSEHKKPYEQLIIGQRQKKNALPEKHVIASVPSLRHSRKPPLGGNIQLAKMYWLLF
ncbi:MT-A70-domain-containing protein [Sporodiniella umbellata]|nr:MT-A70-domain-containing protein [Sporodiniella umbellata]